MTKHIPQEILDVYNKVKKANFEIYLVGGSVRNLLLKKPIKDWDMTTNATPEAILKLFANVQNFAWNILDHTGIV